MTVVCTRHCRPVDGHVGGEGGEGDNRRRVCEWFPSQKRTWVSSGVYHVAPEPPVVPGEAWIPRGANLRPPSKTCLSSLMACPSCPCRSWWVWRVHYLETWLRPSTMRQFFPPFLSRECLRRSRLAETLWLWEEGKHMQNHKRRTQTM